MENNVNATVIPVQAEQRPPVFARVFAIISLVLGIFGLCYEVLAAFISGFMLVISNMASGIDGAEVPAAMAILYGILFSVISLIIAIVGAIFGGIAKKRGVVRCAKAGFTLSIITIVFSLVVIVGVIVLLALGVVGTADFNALASM